jgi:hypothetical protein
MKAADANSRIRRQKLICAAKHAPHPKSDQAWDASRSAVGRTLAHPGRRDRGQARVQLGASIAVDAPPSCRRPRVAECRTT